MSGSPSWVEGTPHLRELGYCHNGFRQFLNKSTICVSLFAYLWKNVRLYEIRTIYEQYAPQNWYKSQLKVTIFYKIRKCILLAEL